MRKFFLIFALLAVPAALAAQSGSGTIRYDTIRRTTVGSSSGIRYDTIRRSTEKIETFDEFRRRNVQASSTATVSSSKQNDAGGARQNTRNTDGWKADGRWQLGGGIGFSWGSAEWSIQLSPQIGYRVARMLVLGGGISYGYYEGRGGFDYHANMMAVNGMAQFYPSRYINIFAQPEVSRQWGRSWGYKVDNDPVFSMPVGVGLIIPVWRGGISVSFYYDVIQNRYSPYGDRITTSIGYVFTW